MTSPRTLAAAPLLLALLAGCSGEAHPDRVAVTLAITPASASSTTAQRAAVQSAAVQSAAVQSPPLLTLLRQLVGPAQAAALAETLPFLDELVLEVSGVGVATLRDDYNPGRFQPSANLPSGIRLNDTEVTLYVPNRAGLSLRLSAYNHAGYRLFSGQGTLAEALAAGGRLDLRLTVDIDERVPRFVAGSDCPDSDADTLCDAYENLFVTRLGVPDIDGDGLDNAHDTDSDADGVADSVELISARNDGYPSFIHKNQGPNRLTLGDLATDEDQPSATLTAVVEDPDLGDVHTLRLDTPPQHGQVSLSGLDYRYTPDADFNGSDHFTLSAGDLGGLWVQGPSVAVTVRARNDAPVAQTPAPLTLDEDTASPLIPLPFSDADLADTIPDSHTLLLDQAPQHGEVALVGTSYRYTPSADYFGPDRFTLRVRDRAGADSAAAEVLVSVTPVNDAPRALLVTDLTTGEDTPSAYASAQVSDPDPDDGHTLFVASAPLHGSVEFAGLDYRYRPAADYHGSDHFTLGVVDAAGLSLTATTAVGVTITPVNDPPSPQDDQFATSRNAALLIDPLANDSDIDGDSLVLVSFTQPADGNLVAEGAQLRFTPTENFVGSTTFSYRVRDPDGLEAGASVTLNVVEGNLPPQITAQPITTDEDLAVEIDLLATASDPEGDPLTLSAFTTPTLGVLEALGAGRVRYTPNADQHGSDSFEYTIADDQGGASSATQSLTITAQNDAPVAQDDSVSVARNTPLPLDLLGNDSDVDGDPLTLLDWGTPGLGSLSLVGAQLVYTPPAEYVGSDGFTYRISDGQGGVGAANVTLTISGDNRPPVLTPPNATTAEDTPITLDLLASASDPDGDTLTLVSFTQPTLGVLEALGAGVLRYTPLTDQFGNDGFDYQVSDTLGATTQATQALTIEPVNDAPIAQDDSVSLAMDQPLDFDPRLNDSDIDGDPLSLIEPLATLISGTLSLNPDGSLHYQPNNGFVGAEGFDYRVGDGQGGSAQAHVTLSVLDRAQQLGLAPDFIQVARGASFTLQAEYQTSDAEGLLTGLGLRIHYDSTRLTWQGFPSLLSFGLVGRDLTPQSDLDDLDADPSTDSYLLVAWSDLDALWPGGLLPQGLYSVQFQVRADAPGGATYVRFSSSASAIGYLFQAVPAQVQVMP